MQHVITACCIGLILVQLCVATDPGVKVRVTQNGINYANQLAHAEIVQQLQWLSIPDQSGSSGHLTYSLYNIRVVSVDPPASSFTLVPEKRGLSWSLSNFGIHIHSDWRVKYRRHVIHISDSGSVDVSLNRISVAETAAFGMDKTGRPSISSSSCSDSVGDVNVKFHGGAAFILNLFRHTVEDKIQDALRPKICEVIVNFINVKAEQSIASADVTVELGKQFLLDYRLVAAPAVSSDMFEVWDKGEIFWEATPQESPFVPAPIPAWADKSRMVYIWVTAYTPNTFLYQAHTHGFLKYNVTSKDLPPEDASYLNTTCSLKCIGTILPQIGKMYPNSTVELRVRTSDVPRADITQTAMTANVDAVVELWAHTPANKMAYLLTLGVNTTLTLNASIVNEKLAGQITSHSVKLSVIKSAVGPLSEPVLNFMFNSILDLVIVPKLNKIAEKGVVLPIVKGVSLSNTQLVLQEGVILVATDVHYAVKDKTLRFESEARPSSPRF